MSTEQLLREITTLKPVSGEKRQVISTANSTAVQLANYQPPAAATLSHNAS